LHTGSTNLSAKRIELTSQRHAAHCDFGSGADDAIFDKVSSLFSLNSRCAAAEVQQGLLEVCGMGVFAKELDFDGLQHDCLIAVVVVEAFGMPEDEGDDVSDESETRYSCFKICSLCEAFCDEGFTGLSEGEAMSMLMGWH